MAVADLPQAMRAKVAPRVVEVGKQRLSRLLDAGLDCTARNGLPMQVGMEQMGTPFRCDIGAQMESRKGAAGSRKGWWGVRVRSEFGAESVLRWWPETGMVDGVVRVTA
jgi:hypothetical protein